MKWFRWIPLMIAVAGIALTASCTTGTVRAEAPAGRRVTVRYQDPHAFTESRQAGWGHEYDHGDYMQKLRAYLVRRAGPMLAPGERLEITFTNIKLAGGYEPWLGPLWSDVRFMRDIYPPRFDLTFRLTGANGEVLREGARKLTDVAYLYDAPTSLNGLDPLHYDKAVLGRWLRRGPDHW